MLDKYFLYAIVSLGMNLSFRLVRNIKDLDGLSGPYRDLTDLFRLATHLHPEITRAWLNDFLSSFGVLSIVCDRTGVVGVARLRFERKLEKLVAEIETPILLAGYSRFCVGGGTTQVSVALILSHTLMRFALKETGADEVNLASTPGFFKRFGYNETGQLTRLL